MTENDAERSEDHQHGTGHGRAASRSQQESEEPTPTLQWIRLTQPGESLPLGEADYVLDSSFDNTAGAWEALVLRQPRDAD